MVSDGTPEFLASSMCSLTKRLIGNHSLALFASLLLDWSIESTVGISPQAESSRAFDHECGAFHMPLSTFGPSSTGLSFATYSVMNSSGVKSSRLSTSQCLISCLRPSQLSSSYKQRLDEG